MSEVLGVEMIKWSCCRWGDRESHDPYTTTSTGQVRFEKDAVFLQPNHEQYGLNLTRALPRQASGGNDDRFIHQSPV